MFSELRTNIFRRQYWKYGSVFVLLFSVFTLFLYLSLYGLRGELQRYCRGDVEKRLDRFVSERSEGMYLTKRRGQTKEGLQGLSFIRLIKENEQFFLTNHPHLNTEFHSMINLAHGDAAVWISLEEDDRDGDWVIAARQLQDGMIIQGGAEYAAVADIYKKLRKMSWSLLLAAAAAAGLLTYYIRKMSRSSLLTAEQALQEILDKTSPTMLQEKSNEELARLYQLLNELISQNRQLIKEMQESLDNVAHDLRTPMTRLRSVAEYGLQKKDPEKLAEALSDCLEESERVLSMLHIMMSVAEAESGTMPLNREEVSLLTTIEDVVILYEYVADEKDIAVEVEVDGSCVIKVDPMRIVQVWANIVDNAIKYGRVGGKVQISSQSNSDSVRIIFKDNGIGISAAEINKIWDRLFRGDRSRSEQGLGLGLNYVKAVIEAHGGSVSVSSRLGEGSVFSIELPLSSA